MSQIYQIPVVNFAYLESEIAKIQKRAIRMGIEPLRLEVVGTVQVEQYDKVLNCKFNSDYNECVIHGELPKFQNWTLIAAIEPVSDTQENVIREVPGQDCPAQFRTTDLHCDHCNSIRKRNAIYVLRHIDGTYKQVGRNCIGDFLGDANPDALLSHARYVFDMMTFINKATKHSYCMGEVTIDIHHFVSVVAMLVRKLGWVPKSHATEEKQATSLIAFGLCTRTHPDTNYVQRNELSVTQQDSDLATEAIKWASQIDSVDANNTYLHDLGVCCRSSYVTFKTSGYVASVIAAFHKCLNYGPKKTSQHVGVIGSRIELKNLKIIRCQDYKDEMYPKSYVTFSDENDNIFVWKASGCPEWLVIGRTVDVKASITHHEVSNGVCQTRLKRVVLNDQST